MTARIGTTARISVFGAPGAVDRVSVRSPWGPNVSCHVMIADRFRRACVEAAAVSRWRPARIDSYNPRQIRGSHEWSVHSWALAWDFFDRPASEPVDVWGPQNAPPEEFCAVFRRWGFSCGRDWTSRKDYPHIEWAAGNPAAVPMPTPIAATEDNDMAWQDNEKDFVLRALSQLLGLPDSGSFGGQTAIYGVVTTIDRKVDAVLKVVGDLDGEDLPDTIEIAGVTYKKEVD